MTKREAYEELDRAWWVAENECGPLDFDFDGCLQALGVTEQEIAAIKAEQAAEREAKKQ